MKQRQLIIENRLENHETIHVLDFSYIIDFNTKKLLISVSETDLKDFLLENSQYNLKIFDGKAVIEITDVNFLYFSEKVTGSSEFFLVFDFEYQN